MYAAQKRYDDLYKAIEKNSVSVKVIKVFNAEMYEIEKTIVKIDANIGSTYLVIDSSINILWHQHN